MPMIPGASEGYKAKGMILSSKKCWEIALLFLWKMGGYFLKGQKGYTLSGLQIKTLMLVCSSFLCPSPLPAQSEYCFRIFLKIMLQRGPPNWLKLTSDLLDILCLQYRIIEFLHWRKHRAGSRADGDHNGLFLSENSARWLGSMGIVQVRLRLPVDRSMDRQYLSRAGLIH